MPLNQNSVFDRTKYIMKIEYLLRFFLCIVKVKFELSMSITVGLNTASSNLNFFFLSYISQHLTAIHHLDYNHFSYHED